MKIRILSGMLLISFGVFCFLYPDLRERETQRSVEHIIEEFRDDHIPEKAQEEGTDSPAWVAAGTEGLTEENRLSNLYAEMQAYNECLKLEGQHIVDAWSYEQSDVDLTSLTEENGALGYIEIPDMEVRLPLFVGASKENLANGAAVLSQTSMPIGGESTNCVIAAHRGWRGSAYFQYIENMQEGSLVYITNPWETLVYRAEEIKVIHPDDVDSIRIQEGRDMITLLSCHPYMSGGKYRYLVYCGRDGTESLSEPEDGTGTQKTEDTQSSKDEGKEKTEEKGRTISQMDLIEWEKYLRSGLPVLTFLAAFLAVLFRHFRRR